MCHAILRAPLGLVQIRAKQSDRQETRALIDEVFADVEARGVPLILNDDVELAVQYPGMGAHVGQDDMDPEHARKLLGPDRILGWSTHSPEQAQKAEEKSSVIDYFAVGPVFATATKPTYEPVGLELVSQVAQRLQPRLPWFAIGGINLNTVEAVVAAGAQRVVVVSDVLLAADPAERARSIVDRLPGPSPEL